MKNCKLTTPFLLANLFLLIMFSYAASASSAVNISAADKSLLRHSINGPQRSTQNQARDGARHPFQTLSFFGVKANATVIEIWPGKGWYSEILAPYLKKGSGQFIAAGFPLHSGPQWRRKMQQAFQDYLTLNPTYYDAVHSVGIGPPYLWSLGEDNSVDTVLTFRNVHNWIKGGYEHKIFQAIFKVLKSGGTLGVVEHRAKAGTDLATMKQSGYISEQHMIKLAQQAGFILAGRSEVNANDKDSKNYAKGVWTLPPTLRLGEQDKDKYIAIGESDRMTLKFRKP